MENKKQIALNFTFNLFITVGLLSLWGGISFLRNKVLDVGYFLGGLALFCIVIPLICVPCCYIFDSEGVTFKYLFLRNEHYLWKNIYKITATVDSTHAKHIIIDSLFSRIFKIEGNVEGEKKAYMTGHLTRNRRTRKLIEKYWDGDISGYSSKKKKSNKTYDTSEIAALEREVQAKASELLEPFAATAKQHNLKLKKSFVYTTEELKELTSRPKESFTYTLIVEISHFGETDPKRVVSVSTDFIFTHLGKNAYKGVVNKHAENELKEYMEVVLGEIYQNGIEVYCKNN